MRKALKFVCFPLMIAVLAGCAPLSSEPTPTVAPYALETSALEITELPSDKGMEQYVQFVVTNESAEDLVCDLVWLHLYDINGKEVGGGRVGSMFLSPGGIYLPSGQMSPVSLSIDRDQRFSTYKTSADSCEKAQDLALTRSFTFAETNLSRYSDNADRVTARMTNVSGSDAEEVSYTAVVMGSSDDVISVNYCDTVRSIDLGETVDVECIVSRVPDSGGNLVWISQGRSVGGSGVARATSVELGAYPSVDTTPASPSVTNLGIKLSAVQSGFEERGFLFQPVPSSDERVGVYGRHGNAASVTLEGNPDYLTRARYSINVDSVSPEELDALPGLSYLAVMVFGEAQYRARISPWLTEPSWESDSFLCFDGYLLHDSSSEELAAISLDIMLEDEWPYTIGGCN